MSILLDTCAAIWVAEGGISDEGEAVLNAAVEGGETVGVSAITAWEVGMLMSKGRMASPLSPLAWFRKFVEEGGMHIWDLTPHVLIASSFLPGDSPKDPSDRIIIATAREHGCRLMTRDREILTYADAGHVRGTAC